MQPQASICIPFYSQQPVDTNTLGSGCIFMGSLQFIDVQFKKGRDIGQMVKCEHALQSIAMSVLLRAMLMAPSLLVVAGQGSLGYAMDHALVIWTPRGLEVWAVPLVKMG